MYYSVNDLYDISLVSTQISVCMLSLQGLDEGETYELFTSFLSNDYRGSKKELQVKLLTDLNQACHTTSIE